MVVGGERDIMCPIRTIRTYSGAEIDIVLVFTGTLSLTVAVNTEMSFFRVVPGGINREIILGLKHVHLVSSDDDSGLIEFLRIVFHDFTGSQSRLYGLGQNLVDLQIFGPELLNFRRRFCFTLPKHIPWLGAATMSPP